MAFLIITESIENTIHSLKSDLRLCERVYKETGNELYKAKAEMYSDKLNAAKRYIKIVERKSSFEMIKNFRTTNPELFISKCSEICKDIKGVYFDKERMLFRVQITRLGKRIYLGQFDSPDDALEILKNYI